MKSWMTIALLLSLALPAAHGAEESDWIYVAFGHDNSELLVRPRTIVQSGDGRKAWFKTTYPEKKQTPAYAKTVDISYHLHSISLNYFRCDVRTMATVQTTYYDDKGAVVGSYEMEVKDARFSEVVPDSVGEEMLEFICRYSLPSKKKP